jgi:predicted enzyme related to lactoylglutathione lyase
MDPVVHFEIPVGDLAAAREFYQKSFGWEVQSFDMPGGGTYTTATSAPVGELSIPQKPGAINGALIDRNQPVGGAEGKLTSPIVTVLVESVEGAIKKVEDAGGRP